MTLFLSTLSVRRATTLSDLALADFVFLSTLSVRRATLHRPFYKPQLPISIHALREESDFPPFAKILARVDFYPRSP